MSTDPPLLHANVDGSPTSQAGEVQNRQHMGQISANVLSSLSTSINDLQQTVSNFHVDFQNVKRVSDRQSIDWQQELDTVKADSHTLKCNSTRFWKFSELPIEMRSYVPLLRVFKV